MARKQKFDKILSENEMQMVSKEIRDVMASNFPKKLLSLVEQTVRRSPLQRQFKEARKSMGLNIKETAAKLKVPQYRLRVIEGGAGR